MEHIKRTKVNITGAFILGNDVNRLLVRGVFLSRYTVFLSCVSSVPMLGATIFKSLNDYDYDYDYVVTMIMTML